MPRLDGISLQRHLTAEGSTTPTIFITAHDDAKTRAEAFEAGATGYLTKPFHDEDLLGAIRQALSEAGRSLPEEK